MPPALTPPYLALLGATMLFMGMGEDSPTWMLAGAVVLLLAVAAGIRAGLHRRWITRLRSDAHPIRAEVTGVVSAPLKVMGRTPHRLLCRGLTPPAVGRIFQSGWMPLGLEEKTGALVTVLIDPKRPSRYVVDVGPEEPVRSPLRRALRHLGALAIVLAIAFVEVVVVEAARPEAPLGPVHGEVNATGARFGKGGLQWRPDLCRPANTASVTAVALIRKDDAFPVAWIIAAPSSRVAAIDVQQSAGGETVRFPAAACTRLHGEINRVSKPGRPSSLAGYADAECRGEGGELTLHADFAQCR